ncbi:MAG: ferredoxin [Acidobacteriota bacterium]|nr:MAG: ferredoxin [Acidobacteriota bacterium]
MSDLQEKLPENKPGRYYVDQSCIDCDVCRDIASDNFTRSASGGYSYVYKQPENEREEALCREAMEACPVEAIGDDGG